MSAQKIGAWDFNYLGCGIVRMTRDDMGPVSVVVNPAGGGWSVTVKVADSDGNDTSIFPAGVFASQWDGMVAGHDRAETIRRTLRQLGV